jgi:hypothetical protein
MSVRTKAENYINSKYQPSYLTMHLIACNSDLNITNYADDEKILIDNTKLGNVKLSIRRIRNGVR